MYDEDSEHWLSQAQLYDPNTMFEHLERFRLSHQYNWVNGRIVYPRAHYDGYLDLLRAGYALLARMGFTPAPSRPPSKTLEERKPRPPGEMVGALNDRAHKESGVGRPAKSVKVKP